MILYHGSNIPFQSIDLEKGVPSKDFGRGFCATVDEFAKRMQFTKLYMQYSFHTKRSLDALHFLEVRDVIRTETAD